jgi:hypothetical protein
MTSPTGDNNFLHELELTVREELTVVEFSPLEEESDDAPTAAWQPDPDGERYEVSLRNLLGAVEAAEEDTPRTP